MFIEDGGDTCFNCRVSSVGFGFSGGAVQGRNGWNTSKKDWMLEHLGTTDDRELGKRGIEVVK